jgi:hypothetical protein
MPIKASPLTKRHFSHSVLWLRRILRGVGGGGLKKGGNTPWATESQRCKSSASFCVRDTFSLSMMLSPLERKKILQTLPAVSHAPIVLN